MFKVGDRIKNISADHGKDFEFPIGSIRTIESIDSTGDIWVRHNKTHCCVEQRTVKLVKSTKKFQKGDRVSFTGFDSQGVNNYKAFYTLLKNPDDCGFVLARHGTKNSTSKPVEINIVGCKRLVKKNGS